MLCGLTTVVILSTSQIELNRRTVAMAEEEVNYATVAFKTKKRSPPKAKEEEIVYNEVRVRSKTTEKTVDTKAKVEEEPVYSEVSERSKTTEKTADTNVSAGLLPDKRTDSRGRCYQQVAYCLGILCVILLLGFISVCVYKNQNLTTTLETQRMMENELNISRAQWSIDAFCPKIQTQKRTCNACQAGWLHSQSSCYAINNPENVNENKTWEEARENCTGKISDLAVIVNETEKTFINDNSWGSSGTKGYWIGLKAEDGNWKWVDRSNLTDTSWIQEPATNGQCVISVQNEGWKSVSCGARNRWICKKKALSV